MAATELTAASAVAAGNDFFDTDASNPPQRVDGPPFDTATAMIDGTAANTVQWYIGDSGTDDPRSTAVARADTSLTVSYGSRANEHGFASRSRAWRSSRRSTSPGPTRTKRRSTTR